MRFRYAFSVTFPNLEKNVHDAQNMNVPSFDFAWLDETTGMWLDADKGDEQSNLDNITIGRKTYDEWVQTGYDVEGFCVACEDWQFAARADPSTTQPTSKPSR
jgi:hypothetical protein